jgi:hypothetical protein
MQSLTSLTNQNDLDGALIACLRIAAARGRAIRENRDKPAEEMKSPNTANVGALARNEQRAAALSFGIIAQTKRAGQDAKTL